MKKLKPVLRRLRAAKKAAKKRGMKRQIKEAIRNLKREFGEDPTAEETAEDIAEALEELAEARSAKVVDGSPSEEYNQQECCQAIHTIREHFDEMSDTDKATAQSGLKQLLAKDYAKPIHGRIERILVDLWAEVDPEEARLDDAIAKIETASPRELPALLATIQGAKSRGLMEKGDDA